MALSIRNTSLLKPMVALAGWTFVMETWMYATRIPAVSKYGVRTDTPEHMAEDWESKVPRSVKQIGDNFNHLHEQPQVFYAVTLGLSLLGDNHPYTQFAAWGYLGIRIFHSFFQSLINRVFIRFQIFVTSSIVLAGLTGRLAQLLFS